MKRFDVAGIEKLLGEEAEQFNARGIDFLVKRCNGREGDKALSFIEACVGGGLIRVDAVEEAERKMNLEGGSLRGGALLIFLLGRRPTFGASGYGISSGAISSELEELVDQIVAECGLGIEGGYAVMRRGSVVKAAELVDDVMAPETEVGGVEAADG